MKQQIPLGPEGFARVFPVSRETLQRLAAYADLLTRWSARINLVGRTTLDDPWRRHVWDAAQLLPLIPAKTRCLVDLGLCQEGAEAEAHGRVEHGFGNAHGLKDRGGQQRAARTGRPG